MEKGLNADAPNVNTSDNGEPDDDDDGDNDDDAAPANSLPEITVIQEPQDITASPTQSGSQVKIAAVDKPPSESGISAPEPTQSADGGKDEAGRTASSHSAATVLSAPSASLQNALQTESAIEKLKTIDFLYYEAHNTAHALELTGYGWSSEFGGKKKKKKKK